MSFNLIKSNSNFLYTTATKTAVRSSISVINNRLLQRTLCSKQINTTYQSASQQSLYKRYFSSTTVTSKTPTYTPYQSVVVTLAGLYILL